MMQKQRRPIKVWNVGSEMCSFYRYLPNSERDRKWSLYITTAGETRIPPDTDYPPCNHPEDYNFNWSRGRALYELALVYISKGCGTFECERNFRQPITPGAVMLLFPNVWHRYRPDRETGWNEHWVGLKGEIVRRWIRDDFFSPKNPVLRCKDEEMLLTLFSTFMRVLRDDQPALQQVLAGITYHIMGLLYSDAQEASPRPYSRTQAAVKKAITQMQASNSKLDIQAFAKEMGMSYSRFRYTFAQHTGSSPHQYLLDLRLTQSRNLLANTDDTVRQIATLVGFRDGHYFSRIFRRRIGLSPSRWRASFQLPRPS